MQQIARNVTMDGCGALRDCRYLVHDRDAKYSAFFVFNHRDGSHQDTGLTGAKSESKMLTPNDGSGRLRRNVCRRSFSSESARCVGRCTSTSRTTIVNGTLKGSRTSCCSRGSRRHAGRGLWDVASGSAGFCAIAIGTLLELAGRRTIMIRHSAPSGRTASSVREPRDHSPCLSCLNQCGNAADRARREHRRFDRGLETSAAEPCARPVAGDVKVGEIRRCR